MDNRITDKITQGMYVLTTNNSGCIIDTVSQVSMSDEPLISIAVNKNNYTNEMITKNRKFAISILSENIEDNVKNIDKEKPTGSCTVSHGSNGSVITISAKDNIGIALYGYNDKKYNTNKLTFNGFFQQGLTINVSFYDFAGNYGTASCVAPAR